MPTQKKKKNKSKKSDNQKNGSTSLKETSPTNILARNIDVENQKSSLIDNGSGCAVITFQPEENPENGKEGENEQGLADSVNNKLENVSFEGNDLVTANVKLENDCVKLTCEPEKNQKNGSFCLKEQALANPTNIIGKNIEDKKEKTSAINNGSICVNLTFEPEENQENGCQGKNEQALLDSVNNKLKNISFQGKDLVVIDIKVENDCIKLTCKPEKKQNNGSFGLKEQAPPNPTNIEAKDNDALFKDKDSFIFCIKIENNVVNLTIKSEENQVNGIKVENEGAVTDTVDLEVKNINISFDGKDLFKDASLLIANGKRYGLVGSKSCGKTTLLKRIANRDFGIPSDLDVLYWQQDIAHSELTVVDFILAPSKKCAQLLAEREKLKAEQEKENCDSSVKDRLAELWEELLMIDPQGIPAGAKAKKILFGLGFSSETFRETITNIPMHLRKRVSLARVLFLEPALLILDEPTIELDINAVIWLQNFLQDWDKTLIIVSQDRCFLDSICNEIIYVEQQKLFQFKGNYSSFEQSVRYWESRKAGVKAQNQANSESGKPYVEQLQKPEFSFSDPVDVERKREFVELLDVTFQYEKKRNSEPIFCKMWRSFNYEPKNLVLGPSRVGKSTLLKLASGQLKPKKGQVNLHPEGIRIGIFDQSSIRQLPAEQSPLEYMTGTFNLQDQDAVQHLSRLGLATHFHSVKMNALPDSEKTLVALAKFCCIPHDVLFMDEPTRYLDIAMIDALADAIHRFKGGLLMVTNNEFLIRETECELTYIINQNLAWVDDFEEYRKKLLTALNEPIRGPFIYKRRTPSTLRVKLHSTSKVIKNYIVNTGADPNIKDIGKYRIVFEETTNRWFCYSPTLSCHAIGKTKESCRKNMCERIESRIEELIEEGREVPPPP